MRKLARLNRTLIGNRPLVCAMIGIVVQCVVICAGVAVCFNVNATDDEFEDFSSEEDFFNFTTPLFKSDQQTFDVNNTGNDTVSTGDLQLQGSQRVVLPVSFSYSTTTEPRPYRGEKKNVRRTVHHRPPAPVVRRHRLVNNPRPYQAYGAPYTVVPLLHYAQLHPKTTVEVEKQEIRKHEDEEKTRPKQSAEEEPNQRVEEDEEDDGGGEEEDEEDNEENTSETEEDKNNSQEDEEESEVDYGPEDNEERGESRDVAVKEDKPQRNIEFIDEYGPTEDEEAHERPPSRGNTRDREQIDESRNQPLKRPKKHQKVEDGLDKELLEPVKFAYNEDSSPSASGHKKHHEGKFEKGGGQAHDSDHHLTHGKKGDKGYKGYHKYDKGQKGHHDKEAHEKKFSDHKGKKAKHKDSGGHYGAHHQEHKGKKGAVYGEKGEHKKGHSTKGEHKIHKKDEYVKKHEFYDEHHEGGEHEKHGGYHEKHGKKHGGKHKKGHKKAGYHDDHHGKKGHHQKGGHHDEHKGHKEAEGHEEHHAHKETYGKKEGQKKGKKWGFDKKQR